MELEELEELWDVAIDKIEAAPLIIATRLGPWLTPLVPAYFVHRAMVSKLDTPVGWAWVAAIALAYSLFLNTYLILDKLLLLRGIIGDEQGYIYILRRDDGIYKVGRAIDVKNRIAQHEKDYGKRFKLIKSWKVSNPNFIERQILSFTKGYEYIEGNRLELRKMNYLQLKLFLLKVNLLCK